jgi:hypothetical protein
MIYLMNDRVVCQLELGQAERLQKGAVFPHLMK